MSPFSILSFRKLYLAKLLSMFGNGIATMGLILLAYHIQTHSSIHQAFSIAFGEQLGLIFAVQILAKVLGTPIMSSIGKRFREKSFLVAMNFISIVCLACLIFTNSMIVLYLLVFIITLCSSGFTPLYNAIIPQLFANEVMYTRALMYNRLAEDMERFLSPLVAVLLLLFIAAHYLFIATIIGFFLSSLLIASTKLPSVTTQVMTLGQNTWHACVAYLQNKRLCFVLICAFISSLLGATVIINSAVFTINVFHSKPADMLYLFIAFGVGSVIMAMAVTHIRKVCSVFHIMLTGSVLALASFVLAAFFVTSWWDLCIAFFIFGLWSAMIDTLINYIVHQEAKGQNAKSLFAANFTLTHLGWLFAYLIAGYVGEWLSISSYFLFAAGVSFILLCILIVGIWPAIRKQSVSNE